MKRNDAFETIFRRSIVWRNVKPIFSVRERERGRERERERERKRKREGKKEKEKKRERERKRKRERGFVCVCEKDFIRERGERERDFIRGRKRERSKDCHSLPPPIICASQLEEFGSSQHVQTRLTCCERFVFFFSIETLKVFKDFREGKN